MDLAPVDLDREPLALLPALAGMPAAALVHVPDPTTPVTLVGVEPAVELRVDARGRATRSDDVACDSDPITALAAFVHAAPLAAAPFPHCGAVLGYLAYELGHWTVPHVAVRTPTEPLAVLRHYDPLWIFDHATRRWSRAGVDAPAQLRLLRSAPILVDESAPLAASALTPAWTRTQYTHAFDAIQEHLRAGDIYQANLTQPYTTTLTEPAWALCARLARRHAVPYVTYFAAGDLHLVANSPELFLRRRGDALETRPIKGTRPRHADAVTDRALAAALLIDEKERAEHIMIVDLERNDVGRVCRAGSVRVDPLMAVESHPSVHHLVSCVSGTMRSDVGLADLLRATFPGGSITGAPKQRAMQILSELEPWPRGPYCGAFGAFDPRGDLELGLAIRTAVIRGGELRWHAGGGIVADSTAEREWDEAWLKTAALRNALAGT